VDEETIVEDPKVNAKLNIVDNVTEELKFNFVSIYINKSSWFMYTKK
jgi:hypothetical protein